MRLETKVLDKWRYNILTCVDGKKQRKYDYADHVCYVSSCFCRMMVVRVVVQQQPASGVVGEIWASNDPGHEQIRAELLSRMDG